jgi:translocation and assembly module TamB
LIDEKAPLKSGTATVSGSYERRAGRPVFRFKGQSQQLAFGRITGGSVKADLDFEQGHLSGSARADLKQLGRTNFDFQDLRGIDVSTPDPARVTGKFAMDGQVRLKDLLDLVPKDVDLPIGRALGIIKYDLSIEREHASPGLPTFHLRVSSQKLQLAGQRRTTTEIKTKEEARAAAPLAIKGIDLDMDLKHAESGETELSASVSDERGKLVALGLEAKVTSPLASVLRELGSQWRELPLHAVVSIPRRDLQQLPVELRPAALSGVISADFASDGRLDAPVLRLSGAIEKLRQTDGKPIGADLTWRGDYADGRGTVSASARMQGRDVVNADIDFATAIGAWLKRVGATEPELDANARVSFDTFPIALLPAASTGQLDGNLTGKFSLEHFGTNAAAAMDLSVQSLRLGNSALGRIHTELVARDGKADLKLRVEGKAGTTTAEAHSGLSWGSRLVPEVRVPADAELHARELRLAAFGPLLTSVFGEIDGRLNGDLHARFQDGAPELDGHADLNDGLAQIASVGQRFDQITARVSLEPGKAKLESLSARATSGKLKVTGEARFTGLTLTGADAQLRIAKSERISFSVAGTEIGETWGAIDVKLRPGAAQSSQTLSVDVPEMHVRLPDTGSQTLQDLEPAKGVRVGTWQRGGEFVTLPLQPLADGDPTKNDNPLRVDLHLGDRVFIQQGDTTKIQLTGRTALVLGDPLSMTGQIDVQGGKLDVSGKQFEIESGVVTFSGDPSNPTIVASARWDAQDDEQHRVYADASGSANNLKVNLRSEPPLTKDQVLSLIVTGSADGSLGGSSGSSTGSGTAATAVGAVGGAATQGINKALSNISALDVSTRVDTSTGSARPELVIQVSARVSAQIVRSLGEPAPGQPPDLTFLTLNFRVLRNWSWSALVGDRGESGLDLVWRRRY